jgi:hypothetical protein
MKLSPDEEAFLIHWMIDETNFEQGPGAAKRLQIQHEVRPARLAEFIAAWEPDPVRQGEIARGPRPSAPPEWPWNTPEEFQRRHHEAIQLRERV